MSQNIRILGIEDEHNIKQINKYVLNLKHSPDI